MRPDDRDEPAALFNPGMVDVDVRGLDDFAQLLRTELDANFKPTGDRVANEHRSGVGFGARNPSGDMQLVRRKYRTCLDRAVQNLDAYVDTSEILIAAAGKIAAAYRDVDALSAAKAREVEIALGQALVDAHTAHEQALAAARQADFDRRGARLDRPGLL